MSGSQKALKIISVVLLAYAVVLLLFGVLMAAGSQVPGLSGSIVDWGDGTSVDAAVAAIGVGIGFAVSGLVYLVIALLGLRGAKDPKKIGAFFALCIVGLALSLVGIGMSAAQGGVQWQSVAGLAIMAVCTFLAAKIRRQA